MNEKSESKDQIDESEQKPVHEKGGFCFSSFVKIFDPNTEEIIVQVRGDN